MSQSDRALHMSTLTQFMKKVNKLPHAPKAVDVYFARSEMNKYVDNKFNQTMIRIKPLAITNTTVECKELIASYNQYDREIYLPSSKSKYVIIRIQNSQTQMEGGAYYYPKQYLPADKLPDEDIDEDIDDNVLDDTLDEVEFNKMLDSPKLADILARIYNQLTKRTISIDLARKILDKRFHKETTLEDIIDKAVNDVMSEN